MSIVETRDRVEELIDFSWAVRAEDLPEAVLHKARDLLLDTVACIHAGSSAGHCDAAAVVCQRHAGQRINLSGHR